MVLVNKCIKVELSATEQHLKKIWHSNESYYRRKYRGEKRLFGFFQWLWFRILDFIWGNGESSYKLFRTGFLFWCLFTIYDVTYFGDLDTISSYTKSFLTMPEIFFGVTIPTQYPKWILSSIVMIRLVGFSLFLSIIIKRFNRR